MKMEHFRHSKGKAELSSRQIIFWGDMWVVSRLFAQLTWAVIKTLVIFWYLEDYTRQICRGFISCGHEIKIPINQSVFHGFMSLAGKGFVAEGFPDLACRWWMLPTVPLTLCVPFCRFVRPPWHVHSPVPVPSTSWFWAQILYRADRYKWSYGAPCKWPEING